MTVNNNMPRLDKHLGDTYRSQSQQETTTGRYGIIMSFNKYTNTATVMLVQENTGAIEGLYKHVPCPVYPGVINAAPRPGEQCWVEFKGRSSAHPIITHYFNHLYKEYEYTERSNANVGVPKFSLNI